MPRQSNARQRILDTAAELFHTHGYRDTGINEIIAKSGTAKATFYTHFPSKQDLGYAWLDMVHTRSEASRADLLASRKSGLSILKSYFKDLVDYLERGNYRGCPYTNTAATLAKEEGQLQSAVEEHKLTIRDFFRQLAARDLTSRAKANSLGDQLFVLYSGATTEAQNLKASWPVAAAATAATVLWKNASRP